MDFAHTFPETAVLRVRGVPGVERADNLIVQFMNIQLPNGAEEGCLVYALEDFRGLEPALERAGRGRGATSSAAANILMDRSAERRFGAVRDRRLPRDPPPPLQDHRHHHGGGVVHHRAHRVHGLRQARRSCSEILQGRTSYVLVKTAPGADVPAVAAEIRRRLPFNDVHTRDEWAREARGRTGSCRPGSGMNMGVTVFLGILVGIVVVAQTLYTSAVEHVKEFGTVKAIGGSNWDIYRILGEQALIAAVVGFVLGGLISLAMRPADGQALPERARVPALRRRRLRGDRADVPGRGHALVPARGQHRPRAGVPGVNATDACDRFPSPYVGTDRVGVDEDQPSSRRARW